MLVGNFIISLTHLLAACSKTYIEVDPDPVGTQGSACTLVEEHKNTHLQDCISLACAKNIDVIFHAGSTCQLRSCTFNHERATFSNDATTSWKYYMYDAGRDTTKIHV